MADHLDVAVVGAGVVGMAIARALALQGKSVVVLEQGPRIAEGVTSRNSGVIHAGLYYAKDSLKARGCVRGNSLLYEYCQSKGVPHRKTGKLVVAATKLEESALEDFSKSAKTCGVEGLELWTGPQVKASEPALNVAAAVYSPSTGIVDPFELTRSLQLDLEEAGGMVFCSSRVTGVEKQNGFYCLQTERGEIRAEGVVNSAGLTSDRVAKLAGIDKYEIYPCRGDYFRFHTSSRYEKLVYPVKKAGSAGLGIHLTIDLAGNYRLGPDAEYVDERDDFSSREQKLEKFRVAAEVLFGKVSPEQLRYDTCGIRPKLKAPHDPEEKDFVISQDLPGWVNCVGIESPGLTASLALAEEVVRLF